MVRSTPFQGVDTGSNPVRITSIMGVRQRWRVGLVCKTSGFRLSEFDSHHSHKCSVRLAGSGRYPFTVKITGSNPVRSTIINGSLAKRQSRETVNLLPSGFVGSSPTRPT
jgi:hypothetical protein